MSALPSQAARVLAFGSIVVGGLAGAVIGFGIVNTQCTGDCTTQKAVGAIFGALFIGIGIAVVAVLVLRAMGEWNAVKEREAQVTLGNRGNLPTSRVPASGDSPDGPPSNGSPSNGPSSNGPSANGSSSDGSSR